MITKLKQLPLKVYLASAFLLVILLLVTIIVPGAVFGFALVLGIVWSIYIIIEYLENK